MGKNQHSKDGLHLRPTEWSQDGRGFKERKSTPFDKLPLHCCALSLQPFETPVCTRDGYIFEVKNIMGYIKRFGKSPIQGGKLTTKELIPVHFHKNAEGKFHCPVTQKVFTHHSHVALNLGSGHVYSWDTVDQLNRKTKNFKDLMTSEPFKWADMIVIQDPDNPEARTISNFYFMQQGQQEEVVAEITHKASKLSAEEKRDTIRQNAALDRINAEKQKIADEKAQEEAEKMKALEGEKKDEEVDVAPLAVQKQNERYSSGEMAASFTSTFVDLKVTNDLRMQTEEEALVDVYETVRVKKTKGYVRLITSMGMLNLELHCDIVPRTTDNFLRLCERGFYDNTIFHRLISNFMLQGGDPTGTGKGGRSAFKDGDAFRDEFESRLTHSGQGIVSMANSGKNTNKSQFFITLKSCEHLNNKHSVFARVVGGLQILPVINGLETGEKDKPKKDIKLLKTEVFKNPFKEAIADMAKPKKMEKIVDIAATWFSNRRDPMEDHRNRSSSSVGKYLDGGLVGGAVAKPISYEEAGVHPKKRQVQELTEEEMEYANVTAKSKRGRTNFDFSKW